MVAIESEMNWGRMNKELVVYSIIKGERGKMAMERMKYV